MLIADLAAFSAALMWAITPLLSVGPARQLGAVAFNRIRMVLVFLMLAAAAFALDGWQTIRPEDLGLLALSGFFGIFVGDTALFSGLRRLGPRRNSILFATNAPIAAVLGYLFLAEILSPSAMIGCALVISGVVLSILFGKRRDQVHMWEAVQGPLVLGVAIALLAGFCQAVGAIIAKPVMESGADPIAASAVRVGVAALCLLLTLTLRSHRDQARAALTPALLGRIVLSGIVGMGFGMSLLLFALAREQTGIVMTLSSTVPVIILPILWITTRERPALGALFGALLAVGGTGMIFLA